MFTWNNKQFLVTVDYYSRYFELDELSSTTSNAIIKRLCHHFGRHGIPQTLISDDGPQYVSEEFRQFAKSWDFEHKTSSPLYSQSNGLAEKTVQTAKRLLSKAQESGTNFERMLLHYRSTPVDNLASPAQLLMGRQIRSTMPATTNMLKPNIIEPEMVKETRTIMQSRQELYYNKHARNESDDLKQGQPVLIQLTPGSKWNNGTIINKADAPRSYHVLVNNNSYRRNRKFIKADKRYKYQANVTDNSTRQDNRCMQDCQKGSNNALNTSKDVTKTGEGYKAKHNNYNNGNGNYAPKYTRIIPRNNVVNQHNSPPNSRNGLRINHGSKDYNTRLKRNIRKPEKLNL